jgi:hypothetical protein
MMRISAALCLILTIVNTSHINAFQSSSHMHVSPSNIADVTRLHMAKANDRDSDFMRFAKQSRSASATDVVVELNRPLGLVLNEDEDGNVYVETVAPKGNAARTGKVRTSYAIN